MTMLRIHPHYRAEIEEWFAEQSFPGRTFPCSTGRWTAPGIRYITPNRGDFAVHMDSKHEFEFRLRWAEAIVDDDEVT